jgi:hypothetical protein
MALLQLLGFFITVAVQTADCSQCASDCTTSSANLLLSIAVDTLQGLPLSSLDCASSAMAPCCQRDEFAAFSGVDVRWILDCLLNWHSGRGPRISFSSSVSPSFAVSL